MWTGSVSDTGYDSTGHLVVNALLSDDASGATVAISRSIAAGTVSKSDALVALINEWVQTETDRMNSFDGIVQPAITELAKTNAVLAAKLNQVQVDPITEPPIGPQA